MDIAIVLYEYFPDSKWELEGFDYEGLVWRSSDKKPSFQELLLYSGLLLQQRQEDEAALELRKLEIENKLSAIGISATDLKDLIGA